MALKVVLSDEEYKTLIRKWVGSSFAATDFFDKYNEILPVEILRIAYEKKVELSNYYSKLVKNSINESGINKN